MTLGVVGAATLGLGLEEVAAQTVDSRHWQGTVAMTRQPEHLVAARKRNGAACGAGSAWRRPTCSSRAA